MKRLIPKLPTARQTQPPSGGCVLKHRLGKRRIFAADPAAFRRLCVETRNLCFNCFISLPAAFRRLCVETCGKRLTKPAYGPAAFRRLCVETSPYRAHNSKSSPAAFRRLCVETKTVKNKRRRYAQPPSGGCVLKRRLDTQWYGFDTQPPSGGCVLKPRVFKNRAG